MNTKTTSWLLIVMTIIAGILGCKKTKTEKEVYKSETLIIKQISKHVYQHTSFFEYESFGKVSGNGMIIANANETIVFIN